MQGQACKPHLRVIAGRPATARPSDDDDPKPGVVAFMDRAALTGALLVSAITMAVVAYFAVLFIFSLA